jgi:hypothetical protein
MLGCMAKGWGARNLLSLVREIGSWFARAIHRLKKIILLVGISLVVTGCPKGRTDFNQGRKNPGPPRLRRSIVMENVDDLFSILFLVQFNPALI